MVSNPFDITKAVDYTDEEIFKFWVNMDGQNFQNIMKPSNPMPMMIVGSKGSGKTHIMKYYSYELQKIRIQHEKKKLREGLSAQKSIGVYIRCSGFNANKFQGKGVDETKWTALYGYFWELWVGERLIRMLLDLKENGAIDDCNETEVIKEIKSLFLEDLDCEDTFIAMRNKLLDLQKDLDYQVQNFMFLDQAAPVVKILLSVNRLTYGIPVILSEKVELFRNKYVMYLIDELENFTEKQQELIQTLLREKPVQCTFRIGTRAYGIRTYKTLGGIEENHDGSEFEKIVLDDVLRRYDKYDQYIINICENRLHNSSLSLPKNFNIKEYIETQTSQDILDKVFSKKELQSQSYFVRLVKNLNSLGKSKLSTKDIDIIVDNLRFEQDRIIERTNVFLIYRKIRDKKFGELIKTSESIKESALRYYTNGDSDTDQHAFIEKYRQDVVDAIAREGRVDIPYNGMDRLIQLSCGTPRTILRLLKSAFDYQYFNTNRLPFEENRMLTCKSQKAGIDNTEDWFFEENRIPSSEQTRVVDSVIRLGNFLQALRFSDLPPQCSINIFSVKIEDLSPKARRTFELLQRYSYFIAQDNRREKNSDNKTQVFQLNAILIPKWELALSKRGLIELNKEEAELIFDIDRQQEYDDMLTKKLKKYKFPFTIEPDYQSDLFGQND